MSDHWKDITGYEGYYQISDTGKVRSLTRTAWNGHAMHTHKGRTLRPGTTGPGYLFVALSKDGVSTNYALHRLVATYFIDNPHSKTVVNHLDGNKQNNHWTNLEWVTPHENTRYAISTGLVTVKADEELVKILRAEYVRGKKGSGYEMLAKKYNISPSACRKIVLMETWKHV